MKTIDSELKGFLKVFQIDPKFTFLLEHYKKYENDMNISQRNKKGDLIRDFLSEDYLCINIPGDTSIDIICIAYIDSLSDYDAFIEGVMNTSLLNLIRYHLLFEPWTQKDTPSIDLDIVLQRAQYLCYKEALTHIKNEFVKYLNLGKEKYLSHAST